MRVSSNGSIDVRLIDFGLAMKIVKLMIFTISLKANFESKFLSLHCMEK